MPDSGQDHTTDSDDGFFMSTACFDMLIASSNAGCFFDLIKAFTTCTRTGLK